MWTKREQKELYLLHHEKAEAGNIESQFKLGEIYEHGKGVVKDHKLAAFWYRKAAEGNHPMALLNLDWMHLKEMGAEQNEGHLNLLIDCTPRCREHKATCRCIEKFSDAVEGNKSKLPFLNKLPHRY